jgi:hypothetical protein
MTLECEVKTKIIMKMNYKLLTKITKHNPKRKNVENKQVIYLEEAFGLRH